MELRPYQQDIKQRVREAYHSFKAPCVVLPCGAGKSYIIADITRSANLKHNRVLALVHKVELLEQLTQTFIDWGVDMNLCDIVMIQSEVNRTYKPHDYYDLIITDENHHAPANSYIKIYNRFPNAKRLGVTATPVNYGRGLITTNDTLIVGVSVQWLIENNYLSKFEYYAPKTLVEVSKLRTTAGDYNQQDILAQIDKPKIYGDTIKCYNKYANGLKTIAFCSSINHSKKTAEEFNNNGIPARHLDGKTDKETRKNIMNEFRSGSIKVICNYEIISEGVSVDDCSCCMLLKPTKSLILYVQSSMRCMRYQEGKTAIILDMVGNYARHGLPDTERKWSLENAKKKRYNVEEQDVKIRLCGKCLLVYSGTGRICKYCGYDNGKTQREIEEDKQAELEQIKKAEKREVAKAVTLNDYKKIEKSRGYKKGWAYKMWKIRQRRYKKK